MAFGRIAFFHGIVFISHFAVVLSLAAPLEMVYQQQVKLLIESIETLNRYNEFDNIILYRTPDEIYEVPAKKNLLTNNYTCSDKSVGDMITHYMYTSQLHKPLMTFSIQPWDYVNNTKSIPNLGRILTNRNMAVVVLHNIYDADVKEFVAKSLGASLETKLVFLLIGQELSDTLPFIRLEKLNRFFRWCWSKNMLHVILLFQKYGVEDIQALTLEIYTYTPFPKPIKLIHLTNKHPSKYFLERTSDIMGYEFKTPVFQNKPSVFKAFNARLGTHIVTGISGNLYVEFVKRINGTFTEITTEPGKSFKNIQNKLLSSRNIDIGIHPFSYMNPNNQYGSYPITNTNSCVVVPVIPEIFPGLYIPRTLNLSMWLLLLLTFLVFQLTYIIIDKFTYGQWTIWHATSVTLRGILNMPLGKINRETCLSRLSSKRKLFIHMLLILTGMIYSQVHIAALTSYLSTTLYGQQLETMEDLKKANISIMLIDYLFNAYKNLKIIPAEYVTSVLITDAETISKHMNSLNISYAYIVYNEEWKVMQSLQRHLWKPRFKVASSLCVPNVYLSLPMQFNSPFYHTLQNFIMTVQETGLEQKWSDNVLWNIRQTTSGSVPLTDNHEHPASLTLAHFTVMWCVYAIGITLSLLVFICEKLWNN